MLDPNSTKLIPPHIVFLVPCYGGAITASCFHSFLNFAEFAQTNGITFEVHTYTHCSLISLGRSVMLSQVVNDFEDYTHVMWVDADIEWKPEYIMMLLAEDKDIIGGQYPLKNYPTKRTSHPVKELEETDVLCQTEYLATGFMLIKRHVCEAMIEHYKDELSFRYFAQGDCVDLFGTMIDKENNNLYLTEDYAFCKRAAAIGFKIYFSKRFELGHAIGSYVFSKEKEMQMLKDYEDLGMVTINKE